MQVKTFGPTGTVKASGAVTARRAVGFDGAQATVAGQKVRGFACADAADGEILTIDERGEIEAISGGDIALGAPLTVDNQGRVVTASAVAVAAGAVAVTSAAANGANAITGGVLPQFVVGDATSAVVGADKPVTVLLRR